MVASIDVRADSKGCWQCFSQAGQFATGREVREWACELEDCCAGEILITYIEHDGTMQGYDLALIEAVAAASMFHFTEQTPAGAKSALATAGVPVRKPFVVKVE